MALAKKLRMTQAYLSLMESGKRRVPPRLARRLARRLDLPPTTLPVPTTSVTRRRPTNDWFEAQLARLGYPGFVYRKRPGAKRHPAEVLLAGLAFDELGPRLVEALPWLLLHYEGLDPELLVADAKARDLQNRLGFVVGIPRKGVIEPRLLEKRFETELRPCVLNEDRHAAVLRLWLDEFFGEKGGTAGCRPRGGFRDPAGRPCSSPCGAPSPPGS